MGTRTGAVTGFIVAAGVIGALALSPAKSEAADMGGIHTLSLTKEYTASPWTKETGWGKVATSKLGFGVKNLLLGWTDLFTVPKKAMDAGDNIFKGIGIGLKDAVENTLGGVVHIVSFPITNLDAPLPDGGVQLLNS